MLLQITNETISVIQELPRILPVSSNPSKFSKASKEPEPQLVGTASWGKDRPRKTGHCARLLCSSIKYRV